jgi:peptide/nickel transport system permease protein
MTATSTENRSLRKFLRHRSAVVSLIVILVYALVALLLIVTHWITLEDTTKRVGPMHIPGLGMGQTAEKRLENAEWLIDRVDSLAGRSNSEEALAGFSDMGQRRIANVSPDELQQRIDDAWQVYDELAEIDDLDAVASMTAPGATQEQAQQLRQQLNLLEQRAEHLLEPMSGKTSFYRKLELLLGTDRQGRSIFLRALYSIRVAILVGLITGVCSVAIGTAAGLLAGYFGGWVDHLITWLYSTFASIPNIVLLILLAFMFDGGHIDRPINEFTGDLLKRMIGGRLDETLIPVYIAFTATFWIGPCRVVRGETLKIRELEYIQAATVMGFGHIRILLKHVLPNITHLMLINFSLLFIGAIKSEVILSYLGLGVKKGPSWGIMISQAGSEVINGFFWQIGTATAFMFCLVLAFNVLSDALQDVLDPKHV